MIELAFHRSIYDAGAVRETAAAFGALASVSVVEHPHALVVTLRDPHPAYGAKLADELANQVLARTVLARRRAA